MSERAHALILPGVGHFAALIRSLDDQGLRGPLLEALRQACPSLEFAWDCRLFTIPAKKPRSYAACNSFLAKSERFRQM